MRKYKILVLTDHRNHSSENSLYPLTQSMRAHPRSAQIDIATRGNSMNNLFFEKMQAKRLLVTQAMGDFSYHPDGLSFRKNLHWESIHSFDVIWLRLPPPVSTNFLHFLACEFPNQIIINDPKGILKTGSKEFLLNFPELTPPMKICRTIEQIIELKKCFPIVLKPLREYGGRGLIKIVEDKVWENDKVQSFSSFLENIKNTRFEYIGVKYLKNVTKGDKRILVVDGHILGATLRIPTKGSWLCNIAKGGKSVHSQVNDEEIGIINQIQPFLSKLGILLYGVDTLVNDKGKRVLSEINTTSIGGFPQMKDPDGRPVVRKATDLIWKYIIEKNSERNAIST